MRITKHTLKHFPADTRLSIVRYLYRYRGDRLPWSVDKNITIAEAIQRRLDIWEYDRKVVTIDAIIEEGS